MSGSETDINFAVPTIDHLEKNKEEKGSLQPSILNEGLVLVNASEDATVIAKRLDELGVI
jgi:hypothetical protein